MEPSPEDPTRIALLALLAGCAVPSQPIGAPTAPAPTDRPTPDLVVRTQADADAACAADVPRAPETLTITGPGIADLSGLHCIEAVHRGLAVHDAPDLRDLHGLHGVVDVGGLSLAHLPALQDTAGLARLARVDGDVGIWDVPGLGALALPALLWVGGDLVVDDAPELEQIVDLRALGGLQGGLHLRGSGVADLSGLDRLGRTLGPVALAGLEGPAALDGLARLTDVGGLAISAAPGLTDLTGLASLLRVRGDLVLDDLPDLRDLRALHDLHAVEGRLVLRDLPALPPGEVGALTDALGGGRVHGGIVVE